jgi:hypothetical protein
MVGWLAESAQAAAGREHDGLRRAGRSSNVWVETRQTNALGVSIAEPLPMFVDQDDLEMTRKQAKKLFDELLRRDDRAVLLLMTQLLARLAEATNG